MRADENYAFSKNANKKTTITVETHGTLKFWMYLLMPLIQLRMWRGSIQGHAGNLLYSVVPHFKTLEISGFICASQPDMRRVILHTAL
jgi:hypothetical protein